MDPLITRAPLAEGYWGKEVVLTYGEIPQRWLVVFSQAAYDRELHTLTKTRKRNGRQLRSSGTN